MYLSNVLVCGCSKEEIKERFSNDLDRIQKILLDMSFDTIRGSGPKYGGRDRQNEIDSLKVKYCWDKMAQNHGWKGCASSKVTESGRKFSFRALGSRFEKVTCVFNTNRDALNRWLYNTAPLAFKYGYIDMPFFILPTQELTRSMFTRPVVHMREDYETVVEEFKQLEPLSHSHPFVILGVSEFPNGEGVDWCEISTEKNISESRIVINRSIEFPPEFRQAGLGILNYFGEVVREKYPNDHAKIKIEQDGLTVRMIIEAENGSREIIEKALAEYELVITGQKPPESLFDDRAKVIELRNELRFAQARIESQKELLEYQREDIRDLKQLFGKALTNAGAPEVNVTVSPCITVSSNQSVSQSVSTQIEDALEDVRCLAEEADAEMLTRLNDLSEALESVAHNPDVLDVKKSGGVIKLKKFLDDAAESGSKVQKFISTVSDGVEVLRGLAKKYNSIAEWCGAPQVPRVFVD